MSRTGKLKIITPDKEPCEIIPDPAVVQGGFALNQISQPSNGAVKLRWDVPPWLILFPFLWWENQDLIHLIIGSFWKIWEKVFPREEKEKTPWGFFSDGISEKVSYFHIFRWWPPSFSFQASALKKNRFPWIIFPYVKREKVIIFWFYIYFLREK